MLPLALALSLGTPKLHLAPPQLVNLAPHPRLADDVLGPEDEHDVARGIEYTGGVLAGLGLLILIAGPNDTTDAAQGLAILAVGGGLILVGGVVYLIGADIVHPWGQRD